MLPGLSSTLILSVTQPAGPATVIISRVVLVISSGLAIELAEDFDLTLLHSEIRRRFFQQAALQEGQVA